MAGWKSRVETGVEHITQTPRLSQLAPPASTRQSAGSDAPGRNPSALPEGISASGDAVAARSMKAHYDAVVFYSCALIPEMDGAQARLGDMLDRLTGEFAAVALYSFDNDPQHPWTDQKRAAFAERWPGIDLITEPQTRPLKYLSYLKKIWLGLFPGKARAILSLKMAGATPAFDRLKRVTRVFIVSYQKGLCELNGIDPAICFIETLDLHFLKMAKVHHKSPISAGSLLKLRAEMGAYAAVRGLFAISPNEATFFRMLLPAVPTRFISSWTVAKPDLGVTRADEPEFDFVFVGSAYQMNARGLCGLYETSGTWLDGYRVAICGKVCDDPAILALAAKHPNISVLGYIDDLGDVFRRSRAALSPVSGTGVKMKILTAIHAGLPVFASRNSIEGLAPGYEGAVFEISEADCRRILGDTAAYESARQAVLAYRRAHGLAGEADAAIAALKQSMQSRSPAELPAVS
jgi:hypothetical protein